MTQEAIPPTVGRSVLYNQYGGGAVSFAAIITHVHNDRLVNVAAFTADGVPMSQLSVQLLQPGDPIPAGHFCAWNEELTRGEEGKDPFRGHDETFDQWIEKADEGFGKIHERLLEIESRLEAGAHRLDQAEHRLDAMNTRLLEATGSIAALEGRINPMAERVSALEAKLMELDEVLAARIQADKAGADEQPPADAGKGGGA